MNSKKNTPKEELNIRLFIAISFIYIIINVIIYMRIIACVLIYFIYNVLCISIIYFHFPLYIYIVYFYLISCIRRYIIIHICYTLSFFLTQDKIWRKNFYWIVKKTVLSSWTTIVDTVIERLKKEFFMDSHGLLRDSSTYFWISRSFLNFEGLFRTV